MKNNLIVFILLIFASLSFAVTTYSGWTSKTFSCNNYEYDATGKCNTAVWWICNDNGSTCDSVHYLCRSLVYTGAGVVFNNTGKMFISGSPACDIIDTGKYIVGCDNGGGDVWLSTPSFIPPFYAGCVTPELTTYNSIINSTNSSYRFNFTLDHTAGYVGIYCLLTLNNPNIDLQVYSRNFTINTTFILGSPTYRQTLIANVKCYYNNTANIQTLFADKQFLVDSFKTYNIFDEQKNIGRASTDPVYLSTGSMLAKLKFYVLSNPDKDDYELDLMGSLTTSVNPASLNCTGVNNYTVIYLTHTIDYPPYSITLTPNWICYAPTTIPVVLTVTDLNTGGTIATANFDIVWATGTMIIDNVNLIKNTNNSNLELWATVSNIFTHYPIPNPLYPASVNLTCNYSMTSQNYTTFTGNTDIYYTNATSGSLTIVTQTDAYNTTVDPSTNFNYRDKFDIQINCSADNYTTASISTTRWVSAKRVKTFACYTGTETTQTHTVFYTDPYRTQSINLYCTVILDTDINSTIDDVIVNEWLQHSNSTYLTLYRNYLSNDFNSPCPDPTTLQVTPVYKNNLKVGIQYIGVQNSLYAETPSCALIPISPGLIANNLVQFYSGDTYNFTTWDYYPHTTAVLAFNLSYLQGATTNTPVLSIFNTKTANKGIVTDGDILKCSNTVTDPNYDISTIIYSVYAYSSSGAGQLCTFAYPSTYDIINSTRTYSNTLVINKDTCPFFNIPDQKGLMRCTSSVYYSGQNTPQDFYSNTLPYITPKSNNTLPVINRSCTNDWRDYFNPNCVGKTNSTGGGITDLLFSNPAGFIIGMGLLIILMPIVIIIARAVWSRNNKGGE